MNRRDFVQLTALASLGLEHRFAAGLSPLGGSDSNKVLGMYIHQHWPYNHPYAARTWTVDDYRGYADGMKKLGYNTFVIWPMLEIIPDPPTPSDQAHLDTIREVTSMLHRDFGMRVMLALCPNIVADNRIAAETPFTKRHFFYCDRFVDPGNAAAIKAMVAWREKLMRPLAEIDGVAIIDSDPGGYPGSTNSQFVNLFEEHRKMLNRLRPGIMLYYWMHVGWQAYCSYYQTGKFRWGTPAESIDILEQLEKVSLKPWGITIHTLSAAPNGTDLQLAERFGLASTALSFNYGAIEGEPTFPLTNFGGSAAYIAGAKSAPDGVVGNAQTHCVQLPNTYAFARGATGKAAPAPRDYVEFADALLHGRGGVIVEGWQALSGDDPARAQKAADRLNALLAQPLTPGDLRGLLFGDPQRFVTDLVMELHMRAAFLEFVAATKSRQDVHGKLKVFANTAGAWQRRTGYQCAWNWPGLAPALKSLNSPAIDAVLDEKGKGPTPDAQIADHFRITESYTPRLIQAMQTSA